MTEDWPTGDKAAPPQAAPTTVAPQPATVSEPEVKLRIASAHSVFEIPYLGVRVTSDEFSSYPPETAAKIVSAARTAGVELEEGN